MEESVEEEQEEYEHAQKHLQEGSGEVLLDLTGARTNHLTRRGRKRLGNGPSFEVI
jgi:hypothetical protein